MSLSDNMQLGENSNDIFSSLLQTKIFLKKEKNMNQNFSLLSERHYYVDISPRITSREKKLLLYVFETYKKYRKNPVKLSSEKIPAILNEEKKDLNIFLEKLSKKRVTYCLKNLYGFSSLFASVINVSESLSFYLSHEITESFNFGTKFYNYDFKSFFLFNEKSSPLFFLEILKRKKDTENEIIISISDLKNILMIENAYDRFYDFERYILKKIFYDVNLFSRFNFSYEKIKKDGRISGLKILFDDFESIQENPDINHLISLAKDHTENYKKLLELVSSALKIKDTETVKKEIIFSIESYTQNFDRFLEKVFNGKIDIYEDLNIVNYYEKEYSNFYTFQSDVIKELKNHTENRSLLEYLSLSYELYSFFYGKQSSYTKLIHNIILKILKIDSVFIVKFIYKI